MVPLDTVTARLFETSLCDAVFTGGNDPAAKGGFVNFAPFLLLMLPKVL